MRAIYKIAFSSVGHPTLPIRAVCGMAYWLRAAITAQDAAPSRNNGQVILSINANDIVTLRNHTSAAAVQPCGRSSHRRHGSGCKRLCAPGEIELIQNFAAGQRGVSRVSRSRGFLLSSFEQSLGQYPVSHMAGPRMTGVAVIRAVIRFSWATRTFPPGLRGTIPGKTGQ